MNGGEGGIRTLGTHKGTTVFETAPIDRSGTSPDDLRASADRVEAVTYMGTPLERKPIRGPRSTPAALAQNAAR